jgi:hypothetical protein
MYLLHRVHERYYSYKHADAAYSCRNQAIHYRHSRGFQISAKPKLRLFGLCRVDPKV